MNRKLRAIFEELKTRHPKSSRVFLNSHGEAYKLVVTVFDDAVRRAGIEIYTTSRDFCLLVMRGVDLRTIQTLMGITRLTGRGDMRRPPAADHSTNAKR